MRHNVPRLGFEPELFVVNGFNYKISTMDRVIEKYIVGNGVICID